mgnify:CR=1 FL=1
MILIKLAKNKNKTIKEAYGKYYARPVVTETIGIDELAEHMASHNTPFSKGAIKGLLTDMVSCVKELVLQNKAVKIDNLAIFSIGIINKMGAASIKEWNLAKFVEGYRLRARATGKLSNTQLSLDANAKNAIENGNGVAWANDNTEVIAFAKQNSGYTVGIPSLGSQDTIAPAVSKGNTTLLDWINDEIKSLGEESFFHKDYEETLVDTYGLDYEDELVVEGGETNA